MMIKKTLIASSIAMLAISSMANAGPKANVVQCATEGNVCELGGGTKEIHIGYYGDGTNPQKFVPVATPGGGVKTMDCDRDALGVADEFADTDELICIYF